MAKYTKGTMTVDEAVVGTKTPEDWKAQGFTMVPEPPANVGATGAGNISGGLSSAPSQGVQSAASMLGDTTSQFTSLKNLMDRMTRRAYNNKPSVDDVLSTFKQTVAAKEGALNPAVAQAAIQAEGDRKYDTVADIYRNTMRTVETMEKTRIDQINKGQDLLMQLAQLGILNEVTGAEYEQIMRGEIPIETLKKMGELKENDQVALLQQKYPEAGIIVGKDNQESASRKIGALVDKDTIREYISTYPEAGVSFSDTPAMAEAKVSAYIAKASQAKYIEAGMKKINSTTELATIARKYGLDKNPELESLFIYRDPYSNDMWLLPPQTAIETGAGGHKLLIDTRTGQTIKDLGLSSAPSGSGGGASGPGEVAETLPDPKTDPWGYAKTLAAWNVDAYDSETGQKISDDSIMNDIRSNTKLTITDAKNIIDEARANKSTKTVPQTIDETWLKNTWTEDKVLLNLEVDYGFKFDDDKLTITDGDGEEHDYASFWTPRSQDQTRYEAAKKQFVADWYKTTMNQIANLKNQGKTNEEIIKELGL